MKKISLLLIMALFVGVCDAQTPKSKLYTYVFADTEDDSIGKGEVKNIHNFTNFMYRIAAQLGESIQMQEVVPFDGYNCSKQSLIDWMDEFTCSPNDIVVFAYMGHGTHAFGDNSTQFPQMLLGSVQDEDLVNLEWVKNQLGKKNPRLCIVLGDCCNSFDENATVKALGSDKVSTTVCCATNNTHVKALKKLFCDFQGSVIASGSKPGELSWINTNPLDTAHAGYFTDVLIRTIENISLSDTTDNLWDVVLKQVQQDPTLRRIMGRGQVYMQHPIYKIEKKQSKSHGDYVTDDDISLPQALLSIGDDKVDRQERVKNVDIVMQQFFADGAVVYFESERGRRLETKYVKDYLKELSRKALFRGAVIRSVVKNTQGKITSLALHEIFEEKTSYENF